MSEQDQRISPLASVIEAGEFGNLSDGAHIELSERLPDSLVQVQAWPETEDAVRQAIETVCGKAPSEDRFTASKTGSALIMPSGPGRWLIEGDERNPEEQLRSNIPTQLGAVTGLSHARIIVGVEGPGSPWLLASGFALDFHEDVFRSGTVQMTRHHDIGVMIHRLDVEVFDLYVMTSFARSFWQWITKASAEVGYRVS